MSATNSPITICHRTVGICCNRPSTILLKIAKVSALSSVPIPSPSPLAVLTFDYFYSHRYCGNLPGTRKRYWRSEFSSARQRWNQFTRTLSNIAVPTILDSSKADIALQSSWLGMCGILWVTNCIHACVKPKCRFWIKLKAILCWLMRF